MDNEKLKEAKRLYQTANSSQKYVLESLFPELCESEDERIRKELIEHFRWNAQILNDFDNKDVITWLEKQNNQKPSVVEFKAKDWYVSKVDGKIRNIYHSVDNPEPKFKVGDWVVYNRNDSSREIMYVYDIRDGRYYFNDNIHFSWSVKECDEKCHLWSIKDAKPGDVLFKDFIGGMTFIFEGVDSEMALLYSFIISNDGGRLAHYNIGKPNTGIGYVEENKNIIHPATKEQRAQLEKAMADAGWTFDFEKNELKKIELNPDDLIEECHQQQADDLIDMVTEKSAWGEKDEEIVQEIIDYLNELYNKDRFGLDEINDKENWLKSLKQRIGE